MKRSSRQQPRGLGFPGAFLVLFVILGVVATAFFGVSAWKRQSDRAACLHNISKIQHAVRTWQSEQGLSSGEQVRLQIRPGGRSEWMDEIPECPVAGAYHLTPFIPTVGEPAATCPQAERLNHIPESTDGW